MWLPEEDDESASLLKGGGSVHGVFNDDATQAVSHNKDKVFIVIHDISLDLH